ncbi:MAG TPA: hypothetical protein VKL22_07565, partial [Actinomycetota bacterium]|nr:hypothetical protein [Actinomycetota bacterium]
MRLLARRRTILSVAMILALALTALTACAKKTTTGTGAGQSATPSAAPSLTATSFTSDFSAMSQLTGLAASGKGSIGVLLPDTASSARYVS